MEQLKLFNDTDNAAARPHFYSLPRDPRPVLPKKIIDITGKKFGWLKVIRVSKYRRSGTVWFCVCDCGVFCEVAGQHLRSGGTKSCGCLIGKAGTHGLTYHRLYAVWADMKTRCYNEKAIGYKYYGGKGIEVCDQWLNDAQAFIHWAILAGHRKGLVIDRINSDGNYEPGNCQFISRSENSIRVKTTSNTDYTGIYKRKDNGKFDSHIHFGGRLYHLGTHATIKQAVDIREKVIELHDLPNKRNQVPK